MNPGSSNTSSLWLRLSGDYWQHWNVCTLLTSPAQEEQLSADASCCTCDIIVIGHAISNIATVITSVFSKGYKTTGSLQNHRVITSISGSRLWYVEMKEKGNCSLLCCVCRGLRRMPTPEQHPAVVMTTNKGGGGQSSDLWHQVELTSKHLSHAHRHNQCIGE